MCSSKTLRNVSQTIYRRFRLPLILFRIVTLIFSFFINVTMFRIPTGSAKNKLREKTDALKVIREKEEPCCKERCLNEIPITLITSRREEYWKKVVQLQCNWLRWLVLTNSQNIPRLILYWSPGFTEQCKQVEKKNNLLVRCLKW